MKEFELKKNKLLKVIWEASVQFRGLMDQSIARDYILALLLKYITDTWKIKRSYTFKNMVAKKILLMN